MILNRKDISVKKLEKRCERNFYYLVGLEVVEPELGARVQAFQVADHVLLEVGDLELLEAVLCIDQSLRKAVEPQMTVKSE